MNTRKVLLTVKGAAHFAHHDGVITTLGHILFTGPNQLNGCAGHLLGDIHNLSGVVLERTTTTKAATQVHFNDIAFISC